MRIELTRVGLLVYLANHYTTYVSMSTYTHNVTTHCNTHESNSVSFPFRSKFTMSPNKIKEDCPNTSLVNDDFCLYCCFQVLLVRFSYSVATRGVMVIVVENGHDDTSSNPGRE